MSEEIENIETTETALDAEVKTPAPKKKRSVVKSILSVMSGSFLSRRRTIAFLPYLLFLSAMALLYIANGYYAEEKIRKINRTANELKELRSEYIINKSDLMFISKQTEVAKAAAPLGLKESVIPPKKIALNQTRPEPPNN